MLLRVPAYLADSFIRLIKSYAPALAPVRALGFSSYLSLNQAAGLLGLTLEDFRHELINSDTLVGFELKNRRTLVHPDEVLTRVKNRAKRQIKTALHGLERLIGEHSTLKGS